MRRLLYLGFAFPPGVASAFPEVIPAGHGFETALITALGRHFEIQSVGLLPTAEADLPPTRDHSPGLPHQLLLVDQAPELFHRWRSARRLRRWYQELVRACWQPDAILVYNLPPVFNDFIRWLHRQPARPATVLLLADSSTLGRRLSFTKRLRYQCKPMIWPDEVMLPFSMRASDSAATRNASSPAKNALALAARRLRSRGRAALAAAESRWSDPLRLLRRPGRPQRRHGTGPDFSGRQSARHPARLRLREAGRGPARAGRERPAAQV